MDTQRNSKRAAILCLVAATIGWGTIPIFLRYFTGFLDKWTVNGVRYAVGALFWLPFVFVLERRRRTQSNPEPGRSVWRDALIPSAANVLGQVGYGASAYFISAPSVAFSVRLSFLFTVILGFLFISEERLLARRPLFWVGALMSVAGVGTLILDKFRGEGGASLVGMGIIVASAVAWGGYAVSVRRKMAGYPVRLSFGVISLYTSAVLLVLMLALGRPGSLGQLSGRLWACLAGSALIGVAFGHVLYYRGIHRLGPVVSSGVLLATPFVTCVGAALVLKENMTYFELAGGLSVILGGALLVRARAQVEPGPG